MSSSNARGKWAAFIASTQPGLPVYWFLAAFFGVFCFYDALDLFWGGTASSYWLIEDAPRYLRQLAALQWALVFCQAAVVALAVLKMQRKSLEHSSERRSLGMQLLLGAIFVLRLIEATEFFGLNDFFYFSVTAGIVAQFFWCARSDGLPRWPRLVLRYQTAWIYFATAVLKLNPHWLSGDHLWIRQQYLAEVLHWPWPQWVRHWTQDIGVNRALAALGVTGEFSLAGLLLFGAPRWLSVALAVMMHGFAALALNVWFFGAAMVIQVAFVAPSPKERSVS